MKFKPLVAFKAKLSTPYRKLLILLNLKNPLYTKSRRSKPRTSKTPKKPQVCFIFPIFRIRKKSKESNRIKESKNVHDLDQKLITSTTNSMATPPVSSAKRFNGGAAEMNVVEEACRSFENYLLEMIVEDGNVMDLMDVEELLYCWKNLKSPVFVDLVSRFYGELCKDLFSPEDS